MTAFLKPPPERPPRLLPLSQALDTLEALEMESGPERPWAGVVLLGALLAALGALPWVRVDEVARAGGWVRPCTGHQVLRSPAGGKVAEVRAGEGDRVEAGAVVLVLEDAALEQRLREADARVARVRQEAEEWATLLGLEDPVGGSAPEGTAPATDWARRLSAERRAADALLGLAEEKAQRDFRRIETLVAQGLVSAREHDDLAHEARLRTTARMGARERVLAEWRQRQRDAEVVLATERAVRAAAEEEKARLTVRAPVAGHLVELAPRSPGSWVAPGEPLGTLSPDDGLRIEARVPARAAARVRPGQAARVELDGLPAADWGRLAGRVESVSPDVVDDRVGGYRVVIAPEAEWLTSIGGALAPIAKGNRADVRLVLGRVSLVRLLVREFRDPFPFPPNLLAAATGGRAGNPGGETKP